MVVVELGVLIYQGAQMAAVHGLTDLFGVANWAAVMLGQNIVRDGYDPLVDATDDDRIVAAMERIASVFDQQARAMPSHADYIARLVAR